MSSSYNDRDVAWSSFISRLTLALIRRSYSDHVINSLFSQIRSWARSDYRTPAAYATGKQHLRCYPQVSSSFVLRSS